MNAIAQREPRLRAMAFLLSKKAIFAIKLTNYESHSNK